MSSASAYLPEAKTVELSYSCYTGVNTHKQLSLKYLTSIHLSKNLRHATENHWQQCKICGIKWAKRCTNRGVVLEHFARDIFSIFRDMYSCTRYKSTAAVVLKGHMNSCGQNLLQQGPIHLEQAFCQRQILSPHVTPETKPIYSAQFIFFSHQTPYTSASNFAFRQRLNLGITLRQWLISNVHYVNVFLPEVPPDK